jgi:hypothetical protein
MPGCWPRECGVMAGSPFASRPAGALIAACSLGAPRAWSVTLAAGPLLIAVVPLTALERMGTVRALIWSLVVGAVGWVVAVAILRVLAALLDRRPTFVKGLNRPWRGAALLVAFGAVAGVGRAAVLTEGASVMGYPETFHIPARLLVSAQVGASWSVVAALIGLAWQRYQSNRTVHITGLALALGVASDAEARSEAQFIAARARRDALAATQELTALSSDASASSDDIVAAARLAASRVRTLSHSLEQTHVPVASELRIRLREIARATARSTPPSLGSMVGGIAWVVTLTLGWTAARTGTLPAFRSAALLLLGSTATTLAARWFWVRWPRGRVITTTALVLVLGGLLPGELILASALGNPYPTGEMLTRVVLAPITAVALLALLAMSSSARLARAEWATSVGPERIEALRREQLRARARRRAGQLLHRGALSRLHAAMLAARIADPAGSSVGQASKGPMISEILEGLAGELPFTGDMLLAGEDAVPLPTASACDAALVSWAGLVAVDVRFDPTLAGTSTPAFVPDIISEAVTNAVRHGGARRISIVLTRDGSALRLSVVDDGSGPLPPDGPHPAGQGSRDLDRWAPGTWQRVGGSSGGTQLSVVIPLEDLAVSPDGATRSPAG